MISYDVCPACVEIVFSKDRIWHDSAFLETSSVELLRIRVFFHALWPWRRVLLYLCFL